MNGAVVSMTVKTASTIASVTPRVLRPAGGTTYSGAGTASTELVFPAGSVTTLPLGSALVIRAGDIVGVQCCRNGGDSIFSTNLPGSGAVFSTWGVGPNPILLDGQTDSPDSIHTDSVLMMNATIEPANVVGVSPAEIKKRSKVNFRVSVPNDGLLGAGGCGASKCKKCKGCYPTAARGQRVVAGQTIRFSLSITRAARSKAADKGKLKFRVPVTYTPDLGTAARVLTDRLVLTAPGKP